MPFKTLIAFDLETCAHPYPRIAMPEPEVATGNLKDPAKIAEKKAEALAKQNERRALDPNFGAICAGAVGVINIHNGAIGEAQANSIMVHAGSPADEWLVAETNLIYSITDALMQLWIEQPSDGDNCAVVTFNGNGFDLPFLFRRAALLNLTLPPQITRWFNWHSMRFRNTLDSPPHHDLYDLLSASEPGQFGPATSYRRNLTNYAKMFGLVAPTLDDIDKSNNIELLATREGRARIEMQALADVKTTLALGARVLPHYGL